MKICSRCNKETVDYANNCSECGYAFNQQVNFDIDNQENVPYQQSVPNEINTPKPNISEYNNYQSYQNPNQQYNNYNQHVPPQNKKSKAVGLILNILVVGLGYAYVGKWGEGIVLLVIYVLMFCLGFVLLFPFIIALAIWIYSLFKTNDMIDKYNAGIPY